jgi:serine/threonine protein kinase
MYRVSKALSALHEKGSTHLDVSPGNILFSRSYRDPLAPNGPSIREIIRGMQVVLSDFGHSNHSQILDQENSTTGEQRGTPAYKSPLLSSHPDRVPRDKDDMFSLGVVFLQALFPLDRCNGVFDNGAFPIDRSNRDYPAYALKQWHTHVSGLSHSHYESVYKTSSPLFSAFPALKDIIFGCLQENEELRPSSNVVSLGLCKMLTDSKTLSDILQNGLLDKVLCFLRLFQYKL